MSEEGKANLQGSHLISLRLDNRYYLRSPKRLYLTQLAVEQSVGTFYVCRLVGNLEVHTPERSVRDRYKGRGIFRFP